MDDIELVREVLDKQLLDCHGTKMGRVDGMVVELRDDAPPRITYFELGFAVLARRVGPRAERWFLAIRDRWSARRVARQRVACSEITELKPQHIALSIDAADTPAFAWELWFRDHIVAKIPGAGVGEEDDDEPKDDESKDDASKDDAK